MRITWIFANNIHKIFNRLNKLERLRPHNLVDGVNVSSMFK